MRANRNPEYFSWKSIAGYFLFFFVAQMYTRILLEEGSLSIYSLPLIAIAVVSLFLIFLRKNPIYLFAGLSGAALPLLLF